MLTVNELAALPDMTPTIFAQVAPVTTVFPETTGAFNTGHASPLARAAMSGDTSSTPDELINQAAIDSQRPDEDLADDNLVGDTMTIRVLARDHTGARVRRMEIIELTGDRSQPYWVRYTE
jgi:type II secretory pathway component PulK